MLLLDRKIGEQIIINDTIIVKVVDIRGGQAKIGVSAPRDIPVQRAELLPRSPRPGSEGSTGEGLRD